MKSFLIVLLFNLFLLTTNANAACSFDSDCPTGYQCNSTNECVAGSWPHGGCAFDSDCPSGFQCNSGECIAGSWPNGGCSFDSDCPTDFTCRGGECEPGNKSLKEVKALLSGQI